MKKFLALMMALVMVLGLAACAKTDAPPVDEDPAGDEVVVEDNGAMTHEEYMAAELDSAVTIETYVQGHQSWWDNKITVYCQSPDGAYFLYELACSEEDAA